MSDIVSFEPGASPPYAVRLTSGGQPADLTGSALFLSVLINKTCYPINGVLDPISGTFYIDLNELEDEYQQTTHKAYLYVKWGGASRPVNIGEVKLKPKRGCVWRPSN